MTWQELVEFARSKTKDEAFRLIDALVALKPELAEAATLAKAFLDPLYSAVAVGERATAAVGEILSLVQKGEGPVSHAPEIGLV